ncbi:MAG: GNAT family N-acetyltransferase [Bacteroidota bacterium]
MLNHLFPVEQIFPALTWRIRHLTMYPEKPYDFVKLENDFDGIHFGIYVDHDLAGVVSLFITADTAQFRKLAVLPAAQHQGLGSKLMEYLIDFCQTQNIRLLWCNARINAKDFYTKFGFRETDQTYSIAALHFVKMELILDKIN